MINTAAIIIVALALITVASLLRQLIDLGELNLQGIKAILEELDAKKTETGDTPDTASWKALYPVPFASISYGIHGSSKPTKTSSTQKGKFKYRMVKSK